MEPTFDTGQVYTNTDRVSGINRDGDAPNRYMERAAFAWNSAHRKGLNPAIRSMLIAFCLHACQSLRESLNILYASDEEKINAISKLPYAKLIELARNHDLHGHPLPICDPAVTSVMLQSGKKPIRLESSDGVSVSIQDGRRPMVRLDPKNHQRGRVVFGEAMITRCVEGELYVQNPSSSGNPVHLLTAMKEFLLAAQVLIPSSENEQDEPAGETTNPEQDD